MWRALENSPATARSPITRLIFGRQRHARCRKRACRDFSTRGPAPKELLVDVAHLENIYKVYAENFKDLAHMGAIMNEAKEIVNNELAKFAKTALDAQLQDEGARSFSKFWNDVMTVIAP